MLISFSTNRQSILFFVLATAITISPSINHSSKTDCSYPHDFSTDPERLTSKSLCEFKQKPKSTPRA